MEQPEEFDTLCAQQEIVREMAFRIRNFLYEEPEGAQARMEKAWPREKIEQMIDFEKETADLLAQVLSTLPKLGKDE